MRELVFENRALDDLEWWVKNNRKVVLRIFRLIRDIQRHPFEGLGKPERLKGHLSGCWSRRINDEHRIVYQVQEEKIKVLQCRYHY